MPADTNGSGSIGIGPALVNEYHGIRIGGNAILPEQFPAGIGLKRGETEPGSGIMSDGETDHPVTKITYPVKKYNRPVGFHFIIIERI